MKQNMKAGSIGVIILVSILLALSGMAAMISAIGETPPNMFYGTVTLNDEAVPAGVAVSAYIDGDLRGSFEIVQTGTYFVGVNGDGSDEGEIITFRICGVLADKTEIWHEYTTPKSRRLDLSAEDYEAPAVTDPDANPSAIAANGAQLSRLNVTVTDNCTVDTVTVNLSAIGGPDAQVMEYIGGDVYSTTTSVAVGTADGTYDLQVNASDIAGNYNDSESIQLIVSDVIGTWREVWMGPESDGGINVTTPEIQEAINCWLDDVWPYDIPVVGGGGHTLTTPEFQEIVKAWLDYDEESS